MFYAVCPAGRHSRWAYTQARQPGQLAYANSTLLYPYKDTRLDTIYNLQFCDNDSLLHSEYRPTGILAQLLNEDVSDEILQTLAMNGDEDTRIRMLAFAQLRKNNQAVPQKILLASIVEVGLAEGLEMLTVYDDRRVRYISAKGALQ